MTGLNGEVALVTGGGSGIGRASAVALARAGARVVVSGRRLEALDQAVAAIRAAGGEGFAVRADVTKGPEVERLIARTVEQFGRLVNGGHRQQRRPVGVQRCRPTRALAIGPHL